MKLWPAIDLLDGVCVRLSQGNYASQKIYSRDPLSAAKEFAAHGASYLHIVDLSRAQDPSRKQTATIARICQQTQLKIQVGGGLRSLEDCAELIALGVDRVVIGSISVMDPVFTQTILAAFPRTVLALDGRFDQQGEFRVATMAWRESAGVTIHEVLARYPQAQTILCTDVERDGMMSGPNLELYRSLKQRYPQMEIVASGGVRECADLAELFRIGVSGVVVGRALYEGTMTIEEGLACSRVV